MKSTQSYCWSSDNEDFRHDCLSDVIDDLRGMYDDSEIVGITVHKGESSVAKPENLFYIDTLFEQLNESAWDEFGESAEDWPDCSQESKKRLEKYIKNWLKKEASCNFWHIRNVQPYVITKEDLE